jgi:glutaredoxin 3
LRASTNQHTVPQIFIKGRSVGGFDQLSELDDSGELTAWLAGSPP